ncbi:MAG: DUF2332 domain-containing protein, partial [Bacteroidota bacterium]
RRQPIPNLFFAAVHYLLLSNPEEKLAIYYPSISKNVGTYLPFELFKEFCIRNKKQIQELEGTKIVQTNSLNRCAYLMPILSNHFYNQAINVIDIGTSAGLTLGLNRYEYHYDDTYLIGESSVKVKSKTKGGQMPDIQAIVTINKKVGIDQNPLDLKVEENANWLRALIWADRVERTENMEAAIAIAQSENIQFEQAFTGTQLEEIIQSQEMEVPLVIYHTNVLYQFTKEERKEFREMIDRIGRDRDLVYIAAEGSAVFDNSDDYTGVLVEKTEYKNQRKSSETVARTNGHANWIKWY